MDNPFFPFRIYSSDMHGGGPYEFQNAFHKNKPETVEIVERFGTFVHKRTERFSWYAFDVIVLSQTEVEFVCFDMEGFCYGGKGKEFHRFTATVDKSVTSPTIGRRLFNRGVERRAYELEQAERKICQKFADEERQELGIKF